MRSNHCFQKSYLFWTAVQKTACSYSSPTESYKITKYKKAILWSCSYLLPLCDTGHSKVKKEFYFSVWMQLELDRQWMPAESKQWIDSE